MVFFFRIAVVVFAKCVLAERNEAVKTALKKMEDATTLLVDNLIAEVAQLRRGNAEMTMKAEILAKEVKRLSPEVQAPAPMVAEREIQEPESDSLEQSDTKSKETSLENSTVGECADDYLKPTAEKVLTDHYGYQGMQNIMTPAFQWSNNEGLTISGNDVLMYAYGPPFAADKQIIAYYRVPADGKILLWWSKYHCIGPCKTCCNNDKSNLPGSGSYVLTLTDKAYNEGDTVSTKMGDYILTHFEGTNWRLKAKTQSQQGTDCYLDHVYVCKKHTFSVESTPKFIDEAGNNCVPK